MSSEQSGFAPVTGGGLQTSPNVQDLKKSEHGEGMTREELNAKKAAALKEAQEAQAKVSAAIPEHK